MPAANANNNLDSHVQLLSYLFKGILVAASPIGGWVVLKAILSIFNNPQYFFLTWLIILAIGLAAEFLTDAWRPSTRLSRNGGGNNGFFATQNNECEPQTSGSPTFLFKPTTTGGNVEGSEKLADWAKNGTGGGEKHAELEEDSPVVHLDTKIQVQSSRPRSSSETRQKGFGKPILVRVGVDYEMESLKSIYANGKLVQQHSPTLTSITVEKTTDSDSGENVSQILTRNENNGIDAQISYSSNENNPIQSDESSDNNSIEEANPLVKKTTKITTQILEENDNCYAIKTAYETEAMHGNVIDKEFAPLQEWGLFGGRLSHKASANQKQQSKIPVQAGLRSKERSLFTNK